MTKRMPAYNSTFAIGGVSCSADSLVVAESFVLRINISGKNPATSPSRKPLCGSLKDDTTNKKQDNKWDLDLIYFSFLSLFP